MKIFSSLLVAILILSACGKDKGATGTALTESQKTQLKEVIVASGRGPMAGMGSVPNRSFTALRSMVREQSYKTDEQTVAMARRLNASIQTGQCSYTQDKQGDPQSELTAGQTQLIDVSLSGNSCPVSTHVMMKSWMASDRHSFGLDVAVQYATKDAEFAKMNDVTEFNLAGNFKVNIASTTAKGDGTIKGNIKSTKYGDVDVNLAYDLNATTEKEDVSYTATYRFKDFAAELKVNQTRQGNEERYTYTVNKNTVTKEEFLSYTSQNPFLSPTVKN